jgi:ABC-2 type transport system permease protein
VLLLANSAGWFVAFFLTGFTMLSCLWAAAGALASRLEDLASTTLPMQLIVTLPFFAAITVTDEGPARTALSYIPLSAPITMPQRLVAGDAQWWEGLISLVVIAVTATIFILLADRLYRGSLLRTGGKTTLKQAWAAAD